MGVVSPLEHPKPPLPAFVFTTSLDSMKRILRMGEFKFGHGSEDFTYFKEQVMDTTYTALRALLRDLEARGLAARCTCNADLKQGWSKCPDCAGCGWREA